MKYLIVIDMQNDFIDAALGTKEAIAIVPNVKNIIKEYRKQNHKIIFTRDTHGNDYSDTQEGKMLPVPHCIENTHGWQISGELEVLPEDLIINKPTFGSLKLAEHLSEINNTENIEDIVLVGLCTDICVISNAMLLKAALPEVPVYVNAQCCAGVTPESHANALKAMTMCQINILNNKS